MKYIGKILRRAGKPRMYIAKSASDFAQPVQEAFFVLCL